MESDVGGKLKYIISADITDFNEGLASASKALDKFAQSLNETASKSGKDLGKGVSEGAEQAQSSISKFVNNSIEELKDFGTQAAKVATNLATTFAGMATATFGAWATKGITDTQFLEDTQIQMQALTHSTELGNKAMAYATQYFKNNPFNRFDVTDATKQLIQFGATVEEVPALLEKMGNVSLSTGVEINELARIYQQTSSDGRVGLMDIEKLAARGVPIWDAFAKATGKSAAAIREETRKGGVAVEDFKKAFDYLVDEEAMKQNEKTFSRQLDRFKGRLSNMKAALAGYSMDMQEGLQIDENGLYRSVTRLMKIFSDTMSGEIGTKLLNSLTKLASKIAPFIDKLADKVPAMLDKLASGIDFLSEHFELMIPILGGALAMFGNLASGIPGLDRVLGPLGNSVGGLTKSFGKLSLPLKILVGILAIGLPKALSNEAFKSSLKSIIESLGKIAQALAPVIARVVEITANIGSGILIGVLNILAPLLKIVADAINALPTPVLEGIIIAIGGFIALKKVSPVLESLSKGFKIFGGIPTKPIEKVGTCIGKFIVGVFSSLGKALPDIAMGTGAILLIGAAIGGFIALVGGGIWVFGQGLSAVGKGFTELSNGIRDLNKADASRIPEVIGDLGEALSGLFWKAFDFATAASTFYGIGVGLQEIAKGLVVMRDVRTRDLDKLAPLAEGLKKFCYQTLNLPWLKTENTLSHFQNLGDAIKNVTDLCNLVANLKVNDKKLVESMTALSNGLKSFLIAELKPSWISKVFGAGDIEVKSVTDYMGSLGSVIGPLNEFQKLISSYNFDADEFSSALSKIAVALRSFLVVEVKPSWINKVFGNYGEVNVKSVTDYLGSLGNIIEPLNKLSEMVKDADFKADEFTTFLSNLGTSLQAFLTYDIEKRVSGFWGLIEGSTKIETKAVLDYFDKFSSVIAALKELQPLAKDSEDLKASDFAKFVESIGDSLQAFLTYDIESTYNQFMGLKTTYKKTAKGILDFMGNLKPVVESLSQLSELAKGYKYNFEREDFVDFVSNIGEALHSFTTYDLETTYSEFLGVSRSTKRTAKGILEGFQNFGTLVAGLRDISNLFKEFGKDIDPDDFTDFLSNVGDALQAFNYFDTEVKASGWGFEAISKTETKSLLSSLGNFVDLGKGLQEIGKVFKDTKLKPRDYTGFLESLGKVLQASTFKTKESKEIRDWFSSDVSNKEYDSIFNHLSHFKDFAESLGSLLKIQELGKDKITGIKNLITDLTTTLNTTVSLFSKETSTSEGTIGYSYETSYKAQYDSVFNHLSHFKEFADSLGTLLTIQELGDAKVAALKDFIIDLAETLNQSTFATGTETEHTYDKFMDVKETTKFSEQRDSIFNHLSGFSTFANSVSTLLEISNNITDAQLANLKTFISDLAVALFDTLFESHAQDSSEASALWGIASAKVDRSSEYDSVLNHMQNFDKFADGVVKIMTAISDINFNKDKFISTIQAIFGALNALMLEETQTTSKNSGGLFGIGASEETASTNYTSIMQYLGDVEKLANVISTLVNNIGVGVAGGAVGDGAMFKTALSNISAGMKTVGDDWSQVAWESIDVNVLNQLNTFLGSFKNTMTGWETTSLRTQADDMSYFMTSFITAFSDTDKITSVVENAKRVGTQLVDTIIEGINSKRDEFIGKIQEFLSTAFPTGYQQASQTLLQATQTEIMDKIFQKMTDEGNQNTLKNVGKTIVEAVRNGFPDGYETLKTGVDGIVNTISEKFYEYTNPGGRFDNIGGYIIDGLERGLNSKKGSLLRTANDIADQIATTIEKAQLVSSPSKRMFKIGGYIGEGLVIGLESQIKSVSEAAEEIADAIRSPFEALDQITVGVSSDVNGVNGNNGNRYLTINQNNNINNGMDYNAMMADLKWELFTA